MPKMGMTEGGIWPAIVGTIMLTLGTALVRAADRHRARASTSPSTRKRGRARASIRLSIANMAGVPSIVYGLFGLAAVRASLLQFGVSLLAGSLTLACLTLPVIITATEEALRQVPQDLRQASLALGATKLRTITRVVLPAAAPGIVTGSHPRPVAGGGRDRADHLHGGRSSHVAACRRSPFDQVMALPYHLYIMATQAGEAGAEHRVGHGVRARRRREHAQRGRGRVALTAKETGSRW